MCSIDLDPCDVWDSTEQRARKAYTCDECRAPIPAGVRYVRTGFLFDGGWGTYRRHVECVALADFVVHEVCGDEGGLAVGEFENELELHDDSPVFDDDDNPIVDQEPRLLDLYHCIRDGYTAQAAEVR